MGLLPGMLLAAWLRARFSFFPPTACWRHLCSPNWKVWKRNSWSWSIPWLSRTCSTIRNTTASSPRPMPICATLLKATAATRPCCRNRPKTSNCCAMMTPKCASLPRKTCAALKRNCPRWSRISSSCCCPRIRWTKRTPFLKSAPVPAAKKRPCLPLTCSACIHAMPKLRAGRWNS